MGALALGDLCARLEKETGETDTDGLLQRIEAAFARVVSSLEGLPNRDGPADDPT